MATPMKDGEVRQVQGSGAKPYVLKNIWIEQLFMAEGFEAIARVGGICDL